MQRWNPVLSSQSYRHLYDCIAQRSLHGWSRIEVDSGFDAGGTTERLWCGETDRKGAAAGARAAGADP
ncbi:hypothetical protein EMIT051CA3_40516 [Pseudomonas chlororaphis]